MLGVLIKENINEGHHTILDQVIMQVDSFDSTCVPTAMRYSMYSAKAIGDVFKS